LLKCNDGSKIYFVNISTFQKISAETTWQKVYYDGTLIKLFKLNEIKKSSLGGIVPNRNICHGKQNEKTLFLRIPRSRVGSHQKIGIEGKKSAFGVVDM
jgi:hypothetical protein